MYTTSTFDDPSVLPEEVRNRYSFMETGSASAIMQAVAPNEWADIVDVLASYELDPQSWMRAGGNRGDVAKEIDDLFGQRGWTEQRLDIESYGYLVNRKGERVHSFEPLVQIGYLVDNFKQHIAVDVEWNAKDGNLDRDMTAYRTWHEAGVLTAGVIITKDQGSLKALMTRLWGDWNSSLPPNERISKPPIDLNTSTTTNFEKAELRVKRGVMGTCPILIVGLSENTWNGQPYVGTTTA